MSGVMLTCTKIGCTETVVLPYADKGKTKVLLAPAEGWGLAPARCPLHSKDSWLDR